MSIKTKITIDNSNFNQGMEQAKNKANETGRQINENARNIAAGLKVAGSEATGLASAIGNLGKVFLGGWISIAVAGITALVKVFKDLYDKSTLSFEQIERGSNEQIKIWDRRAAKSQKAIQKINKDFDRLRELSIIPDKTPEELEELNSIAEAYKKWGLEVDTVTGNIKNLDKAQQAAITNQLRQQISQSKERSRIYKNNIEAYLRQNAEVSSWYSRGKTPSKLFGAADILNYGIDAPLLGYDKLYLSQFDRSLWARGGLTGKQQVLEKLISQPELQADKQQYETLLKMLQAVRNLNDQMGKRKDIQTRIKQLTVTNKNKTERANIQKEKQEQQKSQEQLIKTTDEELKRQEKLNEEKLKSKQQLDEQLKIQQLKNKGLEKEAYIYQRLLAIRKRFPELSKEQIEVYKNNLSKIYDATHIAKPEVKDTKSSWLKTSYTTNDLTSRGGFASGYAEKRQHLVQTIKQSVVQMNKKMTDVVLNTTNNGTVRRGY